MESSLPDEYRYSEEYIQQEQEYIDNEWKNDVSQVHSRYVHLSFLILY